MSPRPATPGMRAIEHYASELWDATSGLIAAYKVDTGDQTTPAVPMWSHLQPHQQMAYVTLLELSGLNRALAQMAQHVATEH